MDSPSDLGDRVDRLTDGHQRGTKSAAILGGPNRRYSDAEILAGAGADGERLRRLRPRPGARGDGRRIRQAEAVGQRRDVPRRGRDEPDRLRVFGVARDLLLRRTHLQSLQHRRAARRPAVRRPETARDGPRHDGRPGLGGGPSSVEVPEEPKAEPWEALPLTDEQRRNNAFVIPPQYRPRVPLRYGDAKDLLLWVYFEGASEIAQHPAIVDVPFKRAASSSFPTTRSGAARPAAANASSSTRS